MWKQQTILEMSMLALDHLGNILQESRKFLCDLPHSQGNFAISHTVHLLI